MNARRERNDNETKDETKGGTIDETRKRLSFSRRSNKLNATHENGGNTFSSFARPPLAGSPLPASLK